MMQLCTLCLTNTVTTNCTECESCKAIPQSHPFRTRVPARIVASTYSDELEVETVEERNKYRRKE